MFCSQIAASVYAAFHPTFTQSFTAYLSTNFIYFDEQPSLISATPNAVYVITKGSYGSLPTWGGQIFRWNSTLGWQKANNGTFIGVPLDAKWLDNSLWLVGYFETVGNQEASGIARFYPSSGVWHAKTNNLYVDGVATAIAVGKKIQYPYSTTYYYIGGEFSKAGSQNISRVVLSGSIYSWSSAGVNLPRPNNGSADMIPVQDITIKQQDWPYSGGYHSGFELTVVGNFKNSSISSFNVAVYREYLYGYQDGWYSLGSGLGEGFYLKCYGEWMARPQYASGLAAHYHQASDKVYLAGNFSVVNGVRCEYIDAYGCVAAGPIRIAQISSGTYLQRLGNLRAITHSPSKIVSSGQNIYFMRNYGVSTGCDPSLDPVQGHSVWRLNAGQ